MSHDLFEIKSFGKINEIKLILTLLIQTQSQLSLSNLRKYCVDISVEFSASFDGIIRLLEVIGYISRSDDLISLNKEYTAESSLIDNAIVAIPTLLLSHLVKYDIINEFIGLDCLDYDVTNSNLIFKNSSIPLKASGLKQFFIDVNVFQLSGNSYTYFLNPAFVGFFEETIIPCIQKNSHYFSEAGLTYDEFKKLQELKNEYGEQAELFVENYERKRLEGHPHIEKVKKISYLKVNSGYDVASFNTLQSEMLDRFIEVKSFSKKPEFYLSKNELAFAELKTGKYFLYLVDRLKMDKPNYQPIIIQDPFTNVFLSNNWKIDTQNWLIRPLL
jgi:hypothetical protein